MSFEVEVKFRAHERKALEAAIRSSGATFSRTRQQVDRYFNHPNRDFAQSDEALRIRQDGDRLRLTYKGPKIDSRTKTREEVEVAIGEGPEDGSRFARILVALGFREVASVQKSRDYWDLTWKNLPLEVTLDEVTGLGTFVEIEASAEKENLEQVRAGVLEFADHLGLKDSVRESYLELLLSRS